MAEIHGALVERILDAHGGWNYWRSLSAVEVDYDASGFLFRAKRVTPLRRARLTASTREPHVVLHDYPAPGRCAVLNGADRVQIVDEGGGVVEERSGPRAAFTEWRRVLRWDAVDFAYFGGYAWWNYLNLPFLLRSPGMQIRAVDTARGLTRLTVDFPPTLPTHCPTQALWFDASGRLVRHDYTAEVVGGWARAAHLCGEYRQFGGLWLPTRRRVYPRGPGGRPLPAPTLVALAVHDARPIPAAQT